ncbi:RF-1 domain-containing protein [Phaeosphaeria sp. MPI-PUGE-AT-0046c]|nr:RF-1 domain-containing protein [Phaeosphaeria sp. MPI-PUGE-AT-0046c]
MNTLLPTFLRLPPIRRAAAITLPIRAFTASSIARAKSLPPRPILHDADIIENFLKGSGPGGQKINKTSSAVQLKHIPTGIVVKYQDTRSRTVNRKMARKILQERIEEKDLGDEARTKVKQREVSKKKKSGEKKRRRKYRKLAEGEEVELDGEEGEGEVDGVVEEGDGSGIQEARREDVGGHEVHGQPARKPEGG